MTNEDLYKLVLTILRKESRGNIIKPDRFSYLLRQAHHEYYNQQVEKWDISQTVHDSLRPFLVANEGLTVTTGSIALSPGTPLPGTPPAEPSATYRNLIGAYVVTTLAKFDVVTPQEWLDRIDDELTAPTVANPIIMATPTTYEILPATGIATAYVSYLKEADYDPFFDYYIDAQRNIQWMDVNGQPYNLQASEVYRDGTTSGDVTSINRELEWADKDKMNILYILLEKIGVSLDPNVAQYGMVKEKQTNVA